MSTLKATNIQNASSATVNLALDANGNATAGGTLVMSSSFLRNRLINGSFAVDQRNAGASQTITAGAALAYTVDRWYAYCTGANVTGQRVTGAVANTYRYQFTGAASVTAIGFAQRIEALNSADLAGKTATFAVDLANSLLTTVTWTAFYANTADTFGTLASPTRTQIATGTFTVNSTVTRYSTNISIPAAATTGIEIVLTVGAQTSGTWTIGNPQLEEGSIATAVEREPVSWTLSKCQRYFFRNNANQSYTIFGFGYSVSSTEIKIYSALPVTMRTTPSATFSTLRCFGGSGSPVTVSAITADVNGTNSGALTITTSGATSFATYYFQADNSTSAFVAYSAEL